MSTKNKTASRQLRKPSESSYRLNEFPIHLKSSMTPYFVSDRGQEVVELERLKGSRTTRRRHREGREHIHKQSRQTRTQTQQVKRDVKEGHTDKHLLPRLLVHPGDVSKGSVLGRWSPLSAPEDRGRQSHRHGLLLGMLRLLLMILVGNKSSLAWWRSHEGSQCRVSRLRVNPVLFPLGSYQGKTRRRGRMSKLVDVVQFTRNYVPPSPSSDKRDVLSLQGYIQLRQVYGIVKYIFFGMISVHS